MTSIELKQVTVVFGRTLALDAIDLTIEPGIIGLFGQNGSGKSTLLRTIAGLIKPATGRVMVDGRAYARGDESLRGELGFAGHESGLYPRLTLQENLELFARLYGTPVERIDATLEELGLSAEGARQVGSLSAGTKRRAAVARALLHDPTVLLLDEPYANLDDEASEKVSASIQRWSQPHKTALIATHGAKKVKAYATAGIILQRGRVVTRGNYEPRFTP
ncbi:MAG TPA: heme ABC exporter ATP-binding protein CcmA [Actinomycetota bacterium]|nr:heme ABC exporter ATP-binding protein CcmA [Actinomycetota bacterium]